MKSQLPRQTIGAAAPSSNSVRKLVRDAQTAILRGDFPTAEAALRRAIACGARDANVLNNLATICDKRGDPIEAILELLAQAVEIDPANLEVRNNFVKVLARRIGGLFREGRFREALGVAQLRVKIAPESAPGHRDLGLCYANTGNLAAGIQCYTRAINLDPNNATYYNDLGLACYRMELLSEAQGAFQEVLRLNPGSAIAYTHLGLLAHRAGLSGVAVNLLRRGLEVDPNCGEAHNNMALYLRDQGDLQGCRHHYQAAMRLKPDSTNVFSSYLLSLNDDPVAEPAWVAAEHRRFQGMITGGQRAVRTSSLDPARKLRVGYLSPDFRKHSVAFFIAPLIENHDRAAVEVTCYSTGNLEDSMTERIKRSSARWRRAFGIGDDDLAAMIQDDAIDVLVELSGHTSENRLVMLARRAAPVQMTYLGYPNTTGLQQMDYRITDAIADPVGASDLLNTETLLRMEGGFLAYQPLDSARNLPTVDLPANQVGHVTFGSFNNLAKINNLVLDTWAAILQQVPSSAVLIKARGLRDDRVQDRILGAFAARGIVGEDRVRLLAHEHSIVDHLKWYNQIDLALDSFPYNGTTTTCEALWMGTPVVTLLGQSHAGRVGASILSRLGLEELVCGSTESYVATAAAMGKDLGKLAALRAGLRERMLSSPLMDAKRLAGELEAAYARAWRERSQEARPSADQDVSRGGC